MIIPMTFASLADSKLSRLFSFAAILVVLFFVASHTLIAHADLVIPDANSVYQFDGTLLDSGSNGWNAAGNAVFTAGKFSDAVSVSPADGAIDLGDHFNQFHGLGNYTFSFWYETSKDDNDAQFLFSNRDVSNGYNGVMCILKGNDDKNGALGCDVIQNNNTSNQFVQWTSQGHEVTKDGKWHYVVLRFGRSGEEPQLFFDDTRAVDTLTRGAGCNSTCNTDSAAHTYLGIENNAQQLTGAIDNFAVISHKMTDAEIAEAWQNGTGDRIVRRESRSGPLLPVSVALLILIGFMFLFMRKKMRLEAVTLFIITGILIVGCAAYYIALSFASPERGPTGSSAPPPPPNLSSAPAATGNPSDHWESSFAFVSYPVSWKDIDGSVISLTKATLDKAASEAGWILALDFNISAGANGFCSSYLYTDAIRRITDESGHESMPLPIPMDRSASCTGSNSALSGQKVIFDNISSSSAEITIAVFNRKGEQQTFFTLIPLSDHTIQAHPAPTQG
jgi:hypothetical protein